MSSLSGTLLNTLLEPVPAIPGIRFASAGRSRAVIGGMILVLAGIYFLVARLGLFLAFETSNVSPVWPPAAIGFVALVVFGPRLWPGILLGEFAANLLAFSAHRGGIHADTLIVSACMGLGNSAAALAGSQWMRFVVQGHPLRDTRRAMKFVAGVPIMCLVSAGVGTASLGLGRLVAWDGLPLAFRTWWLGDMAGILLLAPLLMSWCTRPERNPDSAGLRVELPALAGLLLAAHFVFTRPGDFGGAQPMAYAITPILILMAFRCRPSVAYLGICLVSCVSILGTMHGTGPFSGRSVQDKLLLLQAFLTVVSVTVLFLLASLAERNAAAEALKKSNAGLEKRVEERTADLKANAGELQRKNLELEAAIRNSQAVGREILLSESRFRQLSNAGFEGLVIHEMGRIVMTNPAASALFGYTEEEFLGLALIDFLARESIPAALENMRKGLEEPIVSVGIRKDGTRIHIEVRGRPIEYGGKAMRVVAVRDISERIKAEALQGHAMDALESANRAKSQFLATMSHEIRTPLNGILGMTSALEDSGLGAKQRHYAAILRSCGAALLDQVDGILDLAKIENGSLDLEATGFDLGAVVDEALSSHREQAFRRGLSMTQDIAVLQGIWVEGDPKRLRQVIGNLAANAVKFTEAGWIRIQARVEDKGRILGLEFRVADSGIGMSEATLSRIFKPFVQGDASTSRKFGGSGLGLAICRQLIELMGGYLVAESRAGEGAVFRFQCDFLKAHPALPDPGRAASPDAPHPAPPGRAKSSQSVCLRKVLVVEEDPVHREVARIFLSKQGCEVETVSSGREALEWSARRSYDLILMDCALSGMDGYAAAAAIRERQAGGPQVRIVAMAANPIPGDGERWLASGMDECLIKPLDSASLAGVLGRLHGTENGAKSTSNPKEG